MKRLILALDVDDPEYALEIVDRFKGNVDIFKVGLELFGAGGPQVVRDIHDRGVKVFLDLKFHDIPETVAKAATGAARMGVFMFNMHVSSGFEAMKRCRERVVEVCLKENLARPIILGVTVLTSLDDHELKQEFCIGHGLHTHVRHLAKYAQKAGLDGVVSSAHEADTIRKNCGEGFVIVTPGIRPSWSAPDDQKRTMTPKKAIGQGADYLVMGRSILNQSDPQGALDLINVEILSALS
jgi:orotidine-5'-phosphate decarboxylase